MGVGEARGPQGVGQAGTFGQATPDAKGASAVPMPSNPIQQIGLFHEGLLAPDQPSNLLFVRAIHDGVQDFKGLAGWVTDA